MDTAARVLRRLERIEALGRPSAATAPLLDELRALVRDAETLARERARGGSPAPGRKFEGGWQE